MLYRRRVCFASHLDERERE